MAKKENKDSFDLEQALNDCPKPEWYKTAFLKTMDTSKIKTESDLIKLMKKYGELQ